jgi:hypothetical protein
VGALVVPTNPAFMRQNVGCVSDPVC